MGRAPPESGKTVQATETSFALIELLKEADDAGVTELARALDLSKSTVHDHLYTLRELGYVVREDGRYRLGLQFLDLGDHARNSQNLYHAAKGETDDLVEAVGERGQVMVEENGKGIYIYQVRTDRAVKTDSHIGTTVALHATAVGKSFLAHLPPAERTELLDAIDLRAQTAKTLTDRTALEEQLETIRERGYALNDEERIDGMRAVGAPILSDTGSVLGALSVSGPTTRMNGEWFHEEVPEMVRQAARVIGIRATYS